MDERSSVCAGLVSSAGLCGAARTKSDLLPHLVDEIVLCQVAHTASQTKGNEVAYQGAGFRCHVICVREEENVLRFRKEFCPQGGDQSDLSVGGSTMR